MKTKSVLIFLILASLIAKAQTEHIELFAEIVPGSNYSAVDEFFEWTDKGVVLFEANDDVNGSELWISDGTTDGTYMLKDICPGSDMWDDPYSSYPEYFCAMGDYVYFRAQSLDYGFELWKTDGTQDGTTMVADIFPGAGSGMDQSDYFGVYNGEIYFQAKNSISSRVELWKSDGTEAGTMLVKDINPTENQSSQPRNFVVYNDLLYFTAETEPNHREIYYTDGTELGTQRLSTLPLEESLTVYELFALNDLLIFKAVGDVDLELYASDGTHEGTFLLKDINPDGGSLAQLDQLIVFNNELYFQGYTEDLGNELWKTDGTTDGTVLVKDINPLFDSYALSSTPRSFAVFDNKLFFMADDGVNGSELWTSDGTTDGTMLYSDINSGVGSSWSDYLTVCNNKLYFAANDGTDTKLMSITSSTSEITIHQSELFEYSGASGFISLFVINDKLHFHAILEADKGWELYKLVEEEPNNTTSLFENQISIFPNPIKDYFVVNTTENDFKVQIFSIDGKLVNKFSNQHNINTNNLQSGIYNISIITKTQTFNTKLIKE